MVSRPRAGRRLAGLLVFLLSPVAASAAIPEEEARPRHRLRPTIVSATRTSHSIDPSRVAANVTIITQEDLVRAGATTIPAALSQIEGVTVMDQQGFGLGGDSTVNLRGIVNSARINALVVIDGVRQNRVTGDEMHWQSLPVSQVERIEILRGGSGTIYGEGALGGVINIITKQDTDKGLETEQGVEVGSFGSERYTTNARGRSGMLRYGLSHSRRLTDGYRDFSHSRNTTLRTFVGADPVPGVSGTVHVMHSEDTTGFPGLLTLAQAEQNRRGTNSFHGINMNETDQVSLDLTGGPWEGFTTDLSLSWRRWVQHSEDASASPSNFFTITPAQSLHWRSSYALGTGGLENLLIGGLELADEKATTGYIGNTRNGESNKGSYGVYVEDTLTFWDRVSLIGGLRFDKARFDEAITFPGFNGTLRFEGWTPTLGLTVSAIPEALEFFASYARPFKSPNVDDFSARVDVAYGTTLFGNIDLQPQQADSYEMGTRWFSDWAQAHATAFYTKIDQEILYTYAAGTNQNFDTRRFGTELGLFVQPPEALVRGSATYTFVDAEFGEGGFSGKTIPGTPEHVFNASVGVSPVKNLWVDLSWLLVQDFFRVNDLNNRLGGADNYGIVNLLARYDVPQLRPEAYWPDASVCFRIENLTNEEYSAYQASEATVIGAGEAPAPPLGVYGGVDLKF